MVKKQEPLYIREEGGSITPIESVLGVREPRPMDSHEETGLRVAAALDPERVISREDFMKKLVEDSREIARGNFEAYRPVISALNKYGGMTPRQVSGVTEMTEKIAEEYLKRFQKAGLLEENKGKYTMSPENKKEIMKLFCIESI